MEKPLAFVLMPFSKEFDDIYNDLIWEPLSEQFEIKRADDVSSQQNILRDIVEHIAKANLIIADLTNLNPNVFYEIGIAHTLRKPVILITQNVDEVPFGLRPVNWTLIRQF